MGVIIESVPADKEPEEPDMLEPPPDDAAFVEPDTPAEAPETPETPVDDGRPAVWRGRRGCLIWLAAGGLIVGIGVVGMLLFTLLDAGSSKPSPTRAVVYTTSTPRPTPTPAPTATPTPSPTPDVILLGVKALGELNTVQYNLKTVVEKHVEQSGRVTLFGREIWRPDLHFLLVAGGQVKAGVDFAEMVRYEIADNKVMVYLPAPRITDYAVDTASLKLYYIRTDFGLEEAFVIETYNAAIGEAQENLRQAALESDILETARTNAVALVQSLILGLGFSEVEVRFAEPAGEELAPLEVTPAFVITPAPFATATPEG